MPVNVLPLVGKKMKISGTLKVRMSAFQIDPPLMGVSPDLIRVGDDVKLSFDRMLSQNQLEFCIINQALMHHCSVGISI